MRKNTNNNEQREEFTTEQKMAQIKENVSKEQLLELKNKTKAIPVSKETAQQKILNKIEDDEYEQKLKERKKTHSDSFEDDSRYKTIGDRLVEQESQFTAEQKIAEVTKAIKETTIDDLTPMEELNILEEKGAEYIFNNGEKTYKMYIKPLTIRQQRQIAEHDEKIKVAPQLEQKLITLKLWSELFNADYDELESACTDDDFVNVWAVLAVVQFHGRSIFKKKVIDNKELQTAKRAINHLG